MNQNGPDSKKSDVICFCSGTTTAQLKRVVERGVTDLEGVSQATGACSGCGGCEYEVEELLMGYLYSSGSGTG
jgi:NAD(P)H-nitrite reductase large subunit